MGVLTTTTDTSNLRIVKDICFIINLLFYLLFLKRKNFCGCRTNKSRRNNELIIFIVKISWYKSRYEGDLAVYVESHMSIVGILLKTCPPITRNVFPM